MNKTPLCCVFVVAACLANLRAGLAQDDGSDVTTMQFSIESATPVVQRYLVTYMKSRSDAPRSGTVVTVVNQSGTPCAVTIEWFLGFIPEIAECITTAIIDQGFAFDFCSRGLPENVTTCNVTCEPELSFAEGKAIVSSQGAEGCSSIGVQSRVYYTSGEDSDTGVQAVSDSRVMRVGRVKRND